MPDKSNFHATTLMIEGNGILITGASGSGKSSLCMGLLEKAQGMKLDASLVSDDQVLLEAGQGSLMAHAPQSILGLIEIWGFGPVSLPYTSLCEIRLVVELVEPDAMERLPVPLEILLEGIHLPLLKVPMQNENLASRIVFAWLNQHAGLKVF